MLKKDIRNQKSSQPLYIRLYEHLRHYIDSENARKTGRLPTEMELCRIFGVSRNTVSQALSMLEEEQLICRIKHRGTFLSSAINEFDPQSIRRTIGVVFPFSSPWHNAITAIRKGCRELGYDFHLYSYIWEDRQDELFQIERARKLSGGIILYPSYKGGACEWLQSTQGSCPLVLFDLDVTGFECNLVATDHYQGAYTLVEFLIRRGCRRFCLLTDPRKISSVKLRKAGFLQALEDHNIEHTSRDEWMDFNMEKFPDFLRNGNYDAILDTSKHMINNILPVRGLHLARFDVATDQEKESFNVVLALQHFSALGVNAINLMKSVMRSGMTPFRKILIAPEIHFIKLK
ncbi:MAG: GntR family transcriptional regulator [Lentisphaeria bacterium]|nr:GntR family transcriptional regulator [Lentisphaeria bacterium]